MLPSLDRLAGLIERVVELVDEVSGGRTASADTAEQPAPPVRPDPEPPRADGGWLAYVQSPHGYSLVGVPGSPPSPGDSLELDGVPQRVVRVAASPLPGDGRRCAVLEREEPPQPERTPDA